MSSDPRVLAKFSLQGTERVQPETEDLRFSKTIAIGRTCTCLVDKPGKSAADRILASRVGQYAVGRAMLSKLFNFSDKNFFELSGRRFFLRNPTLFRAQS